MNEKTNTTVPLIVGMIVGAIAFGFIQQGWFVDRLEKSFRECSGSGQIDLKSCVMGEFR